MKFRTFKEKLPVLGSNVLVMNENVPKITIASFTLSVRKRILDPSLNGSYYNHFCSDDSSEDSFAKISSSDYWCYPSELSEMIPNA